MERLNEVISKVRVLHSGLNFLLFYHSVRVISQTLYSRSTGQDRRRDENKEKPRSLTCASENYKRPRCHGPIKLSAPGLTPQAIASQPGSHPEHRSHRQHCPATLSDMPPPAQLVSGPTAKAQGPLHPASTLSPLRHPAAPSSRLRALRAEVAHLAPNSTCSCGGPSAIVCLLHLCGTSPQACVPAPSGL